MTDGTQSRQRPRTDREGRSRSTAVVIGGGLAGITAALSLADAGGFANCGSTVRRRVANCPRSMVSSTRSSASSPVAARPWIAIS